MNHYLSPEKSDFLNLLRWIAALFVVIGHIDMIVGDFTKDFGQVNAFGYLGAHSHAAVIVFFVLSGYIVAYTTNNKNENYCHYRFRDYFLDRCSRIYSVSLIAVLFTISLDSIGGLFNEIYKNPEFIPQDNFALRLLVNTFGIQGIWGYRIQLGSNPALWSIGYEFIFYILYGLFFFRNQLKKTHYLLAIMLVLAIAGWKIIVYFGIWLLGVMSYSYSTGYRLQATGYRLQATGYMVITGNNTNSQSLH